MSEVVEAVDAPADAALDTIPAEPDINLLGDVESEPAASPPEQETSPEAERPEWLPEKFKTPEDLAKSYQELEKKIRQRSEPPETYELQLPEGVEFSDEDAEWFRELGASNEQAQKLLDYMYAEVLPAIQDAQVEVHQERLARAWGVDPGDPAFTQRLAAVKEWADANLPASVVAEMAKTSNGVNALFQMMQAGASVKEATGVSGPVRPTQQELMDLMADPRYQHDEDYRNLVRQKFVEAYD